MAEKKKYKSRFSGLNHDEATAAIVEKTLQKYLEGLINSKPNPNLLDNWYFGNPVNQREHSGNAPSAAYFIDRWKNGVYGPVSFEDGAVILDGTTSYALIMQPIEPLLIDALMEQSQTATMSILTDDGVLYTGSIVVNRAGELSVFLPNNRSYMKLDTRGTDRYFAIVAVDEVLRIKAVKLELGSQQTLAHQDENGNWVLNEIPDYGEQLAKCQRYFRRFPSGYIVGSYQAGNAIFKYPLNPPMRATPTITMHNSSDLTNALHNGTGNTTPSSVVLDWSNNANSIGFYFRGATGDSFVCARYIDVSTDL